ncbi:primase-helicase zinc-binding domain-containing protein [Roseiconus lacunae]|uniref:Primase-helicase zinc-binding domain-containing protein n=1 Tax=Roseiconus lacunae TaxID=2605694 RepID=A0ABT7PEF8_9BACT|nr:primase-helicase zinc-binding domain-containing protein [Roseiconus lacunae]MDM4014606.1 primase-helicase zinc-binding domain-containing protein [Roseiconus lacunae]
MNGFRIEDLLHASRGRWRDALPAAGIAEELLDGRGHPCPRCGGRDRFAARPDVADRGAVHCRHCFTRGCEPFPGDGLATLRWWMGIDTRAACDWLASWLGIRVCTEPRPQSIRRSVHARQSVGRNHDFAGFASRCHSAMRPSWWNRLSNRLNLPIDCLRRLRVGWSADDRATTWPMVDDQNEVVGIRLRSMETGDKWSVRGGQAGLFIPTGISNPERLLICEGPTDCAAMVAIGFDAIGRPSCNGAVAMTTRLVRRIGARECVIIADDDAHGAGIRGAESLAAELLAVCRLVRTMTPPKGVNDARDWINAGASHDDVLGVIGSTEPKSLTITAGVVHGRNTSH